VLKPDYYFNSNQSNFSPKVRKQARILFRRAIREYYVMQRRYVVNPQTGRRVQSVLMGHVIQQQKSQRRRIKVLFTGRSSAGRPTKPEVKLLVARLFILWGKYAYTPASLSWKDHPSIPTYLSVPTAFECFLFDLLPRLGASDVRRYVEAHWKERK
jgi:hypothetical protein